MPGYDLIMIPVTEGRLGQLIAWNPYLIGQLYPHG